MSENFGTKNLYNGPSFGDDGVMNEVSGTDESERESDEDESDAFGSLLKFSVKRHTLIKDFGRVHEDVITKILVL